MNSSKKLPRVRIYTDGACSGNPGPGGYAAIIKFRGKEKEVVGHIDWSTSNRMELVAIIEGLKLLNRKCKVKIFSDSQYCVRSIESGWAKNWRANNWKTSDGLRKNHDLFKKLLDLCAFHSVKLQWIPRNSVELQAKCDKLAVQQSKLKGEKFVKRKC